MDNREKARRITCQLIAKRFLPRKELREIFLDADLLGRVQESLESVGLELAEHIYADYVSVKVGQACEKDVFCTDKGYNASNNLSRGALSLLTIIWAKIILPKRQMQIERRDPADDGQELLFRRPKPIPSGEELVKLEEKALFADFGVKLGGKNMFYRYLSELSKSDFIIRKDGKILEGPLLDVIIDYGTFAPRIIEGALGEMLSVVKNQIDEDTEDVQV